MNSEKEIWTIIKILKWTEEFFQQKNIPSARLDAEILLAKVLGYERIQLYVRYEQPLTKAELAQYREMVVKRAKGCPVAYILGTKQFMHFELKVNEAVLIPRPETELLVEGVLQLPLATPDAVQVLDLCTGSGAIGIALAMYRPTWQITSSDISVAALQVAKENATTYQLNERMNFIESDLFQSIPQADYQIIVANPPYIALKDKASLSREVLQEPEQALFAPQEGLALYARLAQEAARYLAPQGWIALEYGQGQAAAIVDLFKAAGYHKFEIRADYAGIERMLFIQR